MFSSTMKGFHVNPMDSTSDGPRKDEPTAPHASTSMTGAQERAVAASVFGWTLAGAATVVTAFLAFAADAIFYFKYRSDWNSCTFVIGYCIAYIFGVWVMLGVRQGEWTWPVKWIHVLPSVLWTLALLASGEFALFVYGLVVASR